MTRVSMMATVITLLAVTPLQVFSRTIEGRTKTNGGPIETRIYLRKQCLLSEPERVRDVAEAQGLGLAGIFVPILIGKALGGISAALKKAGAEETLRDSARLPAYLYQLSMDGPDRKLMVNSNLGCVILVRGRFSGPDELRTSSRISNFSDGVLSGSTENDEMRRLRRLNQNYIPVTQIVALYEAAINQSNDKVAMHYEPRFLEVNEFQGSRSSRTRAFVVSLAFYAVSSKEGEQALSLSLHNFGEIEKGSVLGPNQLRSKRSSWLGGFGISEAGLKAIEKLRPNTGEVLGVVPTTVEGTFVETEKGSKALRFIAEVLDAGKEDLTKNISGEILRDRAKEAETEAKEEADATEKLYQEEEQAYAGYLKAEAELAAVPPLPANPAQVSVRAQKEFEVRRTRRLWCNKFKMLKALGVDPGGRDPAAVSQCNAQP